MAATQPHTNPSALVSVLVNRSACGSKPANS